MKDAFVDWTGLAAATWAVSLFAGITIWSSLPVYSSKTISFWKRVIGMVVLHIGGFKT